jgi:hypothetical protein
MDFNFQMPSLSVDPLADAEEQLRQAMIAGRRPSMLPRTTRRTNVGGTLTNTVNPGGDTMLPQTTRGMADYFTRQGIDAYAAEPDVSGLQQYAKQRGQEGESAMLNALAAQYAGERFQPVQAQFLKRAMAAQEPLKVGNAGYITPSGEYVKDPAYAQERRAEKFLSLGQLYSGQATREEQAEADRANRMAIAGLRMGANDGANDSRLWRAEDKLRNDFERITGDLRTELGATRKITEIIAATPAGTRPDAITQQSLVILLNKFLDPGSVVREGEFDRVVKAQGLEGRARNLQAYLQRGEPLNDEAIRQINSLAQLYQQAAEAKMRGVAGQYATIARQRGLDVGSVIADGSLLAPVAPAQAAGPQIIDLPAPR